jgi:2-oxoacid:acceptor oxidoreductase delta subunit (pyruvate/2-ketoisovalerate family)
MKQKETTSERTYKELTIGAGGAWYQYAFGGGGGLIVKTGAWRTFRPVIDQKKCTRCGICQMFCPDMSICRTNGEFAVDYDYCKGCLICANVCAPKAITGVREEE